MMEYNELEGEKYEGYGENFREPTISSTSMRTQFNRDIGYEDKDDVFNGDIGAKVLTFEDLHNSPDEHAERSEQSFRMGEKVEALHKSNEYLAALIVAVNREANVYDVSFEDGSEIMDLAPHFIRKVVAAAPPTAASSNGHHHHQHRHHHHKKSSKPHDFSETSTTSNNKPHYKSGDQVQALREGNKLWRFAVIAKVHHDHTYDVIYSDRVRENHLAADLIRPLFDKISDKQQAAADTEPNTATDNNKEVYFTANEKLNQPRPGTKMKQYETLSEDSNNPDQEAGLRVGMEVEARYHGGQLYYPGTVIKVSSRNQTCDIRYEDGDHETFVPVDYIRQRTEDHSRGKSRAKKNDQSNNENQNNQNQSNNPQQRSNDIKNGPSFTKDMAIEGNFQGKNLWYPGTITAVRVMQSDEDDGHEEYRYAVHYRDGDVEENVPECMLRLPKLKKIVGHATYDLDDALPAVTTTTRAPNNTPAHHNAAAAVAASSEGKQGNTKNTRQQGQGQGDNVISTVAGDVVVAARPPNNKRQTSANNNQSQHNVHRIHRPAPVERADSVIVIHGDDDHDNHQRMIPRQPLTPAPSVTVASNNGHGNSFRNNNSNSSGNASSSKSNKTVPQQQLQQQAQQHAMQAVRIEVNYHGQGTWYPAFLVKERRDGTVDVACDNGEKESAVSLDRIRPLQQARHQEQPQQVQQVMRIGDRVVANYQGQGRYYPGVVKKVWRENRFFDILYDDGDEERKIPAEFIHRLEINVNSSASRSANNSRPGTANGNRSNTATSVSASAKTNMQSLALSPRGGRWTEGSLVEMKGASAEGEKEKWLAGRINRLLTSSLGGAVAAVDIKLLNGEIIQEVPVEYIRTPRKKSVNSISPAMTLDMSAGCKPKAQTKANNNSNRGNSSDPLLLNEKDITALRLLLQQKDSEIERLKVGNDMPKQQLGGRRASTANVKVCRSSDTALDTTTSPVYQTPFMTESGGSELAALIKANDELKRSVAFLGQKFTIVVEELVQVKQREEQQLQKQADMLRQVVDGQKKMAAMLNNSYRN